ncbi:Ig-like domain-containing protein [Pseudomonas stutzeri]|nr:Ig-like domain-containing protein [Stutzerimonas stutzeri]
MPSAFSTALPPVPLVTLAMLRLSPSTSLSLPSRSAALKVTGVSSVAATQNDAVTVSEDVPFSSSISLLANDSDIDGDTLSVVAGTFVTAQGGSIVIAADGSYTTLTLTVTPVNDAPLANDDSLAATEDTPVTFAAADLLGNDSDVDGDSLSIASVTSARPRCR